MLRYDICVMIGAHRLEITMDLFTKPLISLLTAQLAKYKYRALFELDSTLREQATREVRRILEIMEEVECTEKS
jgi:hypothetical protein